MYNRFTAARSGDSGSKLSEHDGFPAPPRYPPRYDRPDPPNQDLDQQLSAQTLIFNQVARDKKRAIAGITC
jgi:hypothetical protein